MNNKGGHPFMSDRIVVNVGDPEHEEHFNGSWLVFPDPVLTRSNEGEVVDGAFFGIASTDGGGVSVLIQDADGARPSWLSFHSTLKQACYEAHLIPLDIFHAARLAQRVQKMTSSAQRMARKQDVRRRRIVASELVLFGVSTLEELPPLVQRSLQGAG